MLRPPTTGSAQTPVSRGHSHPPTVSQAHGLPTPSWLCLALPLTPLGQSEGQLGPCFIQPGEMRQERVRAFGDP